MPKEYKELELARAKREPVAHLWSNRDWVAEKKYDGHRYLMHFGGPCSRLYMVSRRGEEVGLCVPQFAPQTNISNLGYTVLDGEVVPPDGHEFHDVASYTRVDPLVAWARRRQGEVTYKSFDVLFINGTDVRSQSDERRHELLNAIITQVFCNHLFVQLGERATVNTHQFLLQILAAGGEGVILKNTQSTYGRGWIKAKRVSTFDVIITGFKPGYDIKHGAVVMSVCDGINLREVGKCGIANEQIRLAMDRNHNEFLGQVIEVKALKIDPSNGSLREPRFVRLRPDLSPLDCTWEKLNRDTMRIELE